MLVNVWHSNVILSTWWWSLQLRGPGVPYFSVKSAVEPPVKVNINEARAGEFTLDSIQGMKPQRLVSNLSNQAVDKNTHIFHHISP